jgi:acyl carrier protein
MVEQIKRIIGQVVENESISENLSDNADIIHDVGLDSLQMIEFMLRIEEEFNIELAFDTLDISHLYSIKTFSDFISSQKHAQ